MLSDSRKHVALFLVLLTALAGTAFQATAASIVLEAENGILTGNCRVTRNAPGFSGSGFVAGFENTNDTVNWNFTGNPGLYDLLIRYRSHSGPKGFAGSINSNDFSGTFRSNSAFASFDVGRVEVLTGTNTLKIGGGWNWYEIDRVDLNPIPTSPPAPVPATLTDPLATAATHNLIARLVTEYGKHTWSGQYGSNETAYIFSTSGVKPIVFGDDLIDYSPSRVAFGNQPTNLTESCIALARNGHVITMSWHWNAPSGLLNSKKEPWWRGFYAKATTFDFPAALANTNSAQYAEMIRDIDAIAVQLKKFSDADVPILWRPLHEADGGWFWWGAKGPRPFKALWRLLYHRLTVDHNLHNLVWVYTGEKPEWYPGNDVVDIIGLDAYPKNPRDVLLPKWEMLKTRFDGVKPIALTEFGGMPDIESMQACGVWWCYSVSWTWNPTNPPSAAAILRTYQSPSVIILNRPLPAIDNK